MTNRGLSLVEVLVTGVIASVMMLGSAHTLMLAMQASGVSRAILTENDFKFTLSKALKENCTANLRTVSITNKENAVIPVTELKLKVDDTDPIIKTGKTFKGDIEVVKMEVKAQDKTDTSREFIAYYKKTNLGDLNTVAGGKCEKTGENTYKLSGCFKTQCKLKYELGDNDETTDKVETGFLKTCESLTCHPVVLQVAGGIGPKCPWGSIWKNNKCDNREDKGTGNCNRPEGSLFVHSTFGTARVEKDGKCVCEDKRVETAEGLCYKASQAYGEVHCWPRKKSWDASAVGAFCSEKYQGTELCLKEPKQWITDKDHACLKHLSEQNREDVTREHTEHKIKRETYYKRFYNRETGKVRCIKYDYCYNFAIERTQSQGETISRWVKKADITSPVSVDWFTPQLQ